MSQSRRAVDQHSQRLGLLARPLVQQDTSISFVLADGMVAVLMRVQFNGLDKIQIGNDGPSRQRRQRRVGRVITQRCPTGNAVDLLQGVLLSTLRTESHYDGRERRGGLLRHSTHTSLALAVSNVSPLAQRN